jgi:hypothetical protein
MAVRKTENEEGHNVNGTKGILRVFCFIAFVAGTLIVSNIQAVERRKAPGKEYQLQGHRIEAGLDLEQHRLDAVDRVTLGKTGRGSRTWRFRLDPELGIESVRVGDIPVDFHRIEEEMAGGSSGSGDAENGRHPILWEIDLKGVDGTGEEIVVDIAYSGVIYDTLKVPSFSREFIANQTTGIIGTEGVYLGEASAWYPRRSGSLVPFTLDITVSSEFEVVSQGKLEVNEVQDGIRKVRWNCTRPTDVIYLIAGNYEVEERDVDGVTIYAYFFPKSRDLRDSYLSATDRYIRMYTEMIGPYPYEKFAVVENFFETGYGMPSFTLLGSTVIRLPFIVYTSLGHEVLHNWWGNSVFVDSSSGNWCESLTTYMADYHYKEQRGGGEARDYRMEINKEYSNYVNENNDFSLATFTSRTTPATRTVGYGKGAMIYHGLRRILGDEAFYGALKSFYRNHIYRYASWDDLRAEFEKAGGVDLDWYFDQWIQGVGGPMLHLKDVGMPGESPKSVTFTLSQEGADAPYRIDVPVVLETTEGAEEHFLAFHELETAFSVQSRGTPVSLSVDPDFHLFRRMNPLEIPPSLSMVLGDEKEMLVLPNRADSTIRKAYEELAGQINRTGKAEVKSAADVEAVDLEEYSLFIFGSPDQNSAWGLLGEVSHGSIEVRGDEVAVAGTSYPAAAHSFLAVLRNRHDPVKGVALFFGPDADHIREVGRKLVHYGKYGYLVFEGSQNIAKGSWEVENSPLIHRF